MTAGRRRAAKLASRRFGRAVAKRALTASPYVGAGLAAGAIVGYGAYRGIKAIRARRARMKKKSTIGLSPNSRATARNLAVATQDMTAKNTRTQYTIALANITRGTGLSDRKTDRVIIKGFHIRMNLQTLINSQAVVVNFALVAPKNGTSVSTAEFFRQYGTDRAQDFNPTSQGYIDMMQTPINSDQYVVLQRWRVALGPQINQTSTTAATSTLTARSFNRYFKFNRQLQYESSGTVPEADNPHLVYWADIKYSTIGGSVVASAFQNQYTIITYFKDAECC